MKKLLDQIHNANIDSKELMPTPAQINAELALSEKTARFILESRQVIEKILDHQEQRLFVVVGPCSIHDPEAALEYAEKLQKLASQVSDTLYLVMRVYFEKPRTTVGWKGLINDPDMDDSFHIEKGIRMARKLLLQLADMRIPCATEALDPIIPQYLSDLLTWVAIGARTTESQTHREMASGLSMPTGFKNGTDGSLDVATNALKSVSQPHHFLGIDRQGHSAVFRTKGNRYGHVVLRGGGGKPNYDSVHVKLCERALQQAGLPINIVVDCSHGNSNKDHALQPLVGDDCVHQIIEGNQSICGLMLESNLQAGNQSIPNDLNKLQYGVSVTDACIDWQTTANSINNWHMKLQDTLPVRLRMLQEGQK